MSRFGNCVHFGIEFLNLQEGFIHHFIPVGKDLLQFFPDKEMAHPSQNAERNGIVNQVGHLHPALNGFEEVFVVPEFIGAKALFVDEEFILLYLGDLRDPGYRYAQHGFYFVGDDLTRIHF